MEGKLSVTREETSHPPGKVLCTMGWKVDAGVYVHDVIVYSAGGKSIRGYLFYFAVYVRYKPA